MNEAFTVEIHKNIEHRFEHFASFGSPESALGNNLGKVFLGILHHHVETIPVFQPAAADVEYLQQIGMNELHNAAPERELEIGGGTSRNEFDGGSLRLRIGEMREEHRGVVRTSKMRIPASRPMGTLPQAWRATAERIARRLGQGWNGSTCDSQAPGAGRSSLTFCHETGRNGEHASYRLWRGPRRPERRFERAAFEEAAWIKDSQAETQARRTFKQAFSSKPRFSRLPRMSCEALPRGEGAWGR